MALLNELDALGWGAWRQELEALLAEKERFISQVDGNARRLLPLLERLPGRRGGRRFWFGCEFRFWKRGLGFGNRFGFGQRHGIPRQAVTQRQPPDVEQVDDRNASCGHLEQRSPLRRCR